MFPLTPVALHKGWVEGKERIVTCVSGRYMWPHAERPHSRLFDMEGRPVAHKFGMVKVDGRWEISVTIRDWEQIAIIEK